MADENGRPTWRDLAEMRRDLNEEIKTQVRLIVADELRARLTGRLPESETWQTTLLRNPVLAAMIFLFLLLGANLLGIDLPALLGAR